MKLMIASDIHGSAHYCRKLVDLFHKEQPDRLLLLGDILYHGPRNNLPREYNPKEVITMLNHWYVFAAIVTQKWTKWCWNFRFWPNPACCIGMDVWYMPAMATM